MLEAPKLRWAAVAYLHAPCETHLSLYRQALRILRAYVQALGRYSDTATGARREALAAQASALPADAFPGIQPLLLQGLFWYHRDVGADCLNALVDGWARLPAALMDRTETGPTYLVLYGAVHLLAQPVIPMRRARRARRARTRGGGL